VAGPFVSLAALGALCYYQAESIAQADGTFVTPWADGSGNGRTATGGGADILRAKYRTNQYGNGPAVEFDDNSFTRQLNTASISHGIGTGAFSVWFLLRLPTSHSIPWTPGLTYNVSCDLVMLNPANSDGLVSIQDETLMFSRSLVTATCPLPVYDNWRHLYWHAVVISRSAAGDLTWSIDGQEAVQGNVPGSLPNDAFRIGPRPNGYLKDVGFINRQLDQMERFGLMEYLATRAPVDTVYRGATNRLVTVNPSTWGRSVYAHTGRQYGGAAKFATVNNWPRIEVQCAFATNPADAPTWIDLTERLRSMWIRRGRSTELSRYEAGTAGVVLDNRDRALDPSNTASPFYPNVRPMRRFRIVGRWGYTTYPLFSGYVERWPPSWDEHGTDGTVEVQLTDAFKVLALRKIGDSGGSVSLAIQRSDVRIANILSLMGWPTTDQMLNVGQSNVLDVTLDKVPALEHIQAVEEAENGQFFVRGDGVLIFLDRLTPSLIGATGGGVFGDADGELPYEALGFEYGDEQIWNDVKLTRAGGAEQSVTDATSIAQYLQRTLSKTGMLITSNAEVLAAAQYHLAKRKQPVFRFPTMRVNPLLDPEALWPVVLGMDLSTAVTVRRRPPDTTGVGPVIELTVAIQGINIDVTRGHWTTDYSLGQPDIQALFQLDSLTNAQLGAFQGDPAGTAVLSY